jgi:hypothetical protein
VLAGRGDVPLTELRFRCSQCSTDRTDFVVTSRQPAAVVRQADADQSGVTPVGRRKAAHRLTAAPGVFAT